MIITSAFGLIHSVESKMNGSTVILTKWIENVQRWMSNAKVEFKKRNDKRKNFFQWCEIKKKSVKF